MHRLVGCYAEQIKLLIRVSLVHRSLLRWIGSTENGDARWTSCQGCSLPKGTAGLHLAAIKELAFDIERDLFAMV